MRALRWTIAVVVVLWLAAELAAPAFAEARLEARVEQSVEGVDDVDADVGSFPVIARYIVTGEISRLDVSLERVARQQLAFTDVRFGLRGVEVDRTSALGGEVDVTDIDAGRVTAQLDLDELSRALGEPLDVGAADVVVDGRQLLLGGIAAVAIPDDLVPCAPDAAVEDGRVTLTCELEEVPSLLVRAAG